MEYEGRQWLDLSAEERVEALAFIPRVFDQDLGPHFINCVGQKVEILQQKFDLGKTWEGVRERMRVVEG